MTEAKLKYSIEPDNDHIQTNNTELETPHSLMCWSYSYLQICIISWKDEQLTFGVYLSGIQVYKGTLEANQCVEVEKGDFIKAKAKICLDIENRAVTAVGYLRAAGQRFNFDGVIINF